MVDGHRVRREIRHDASGNEIPDYIPCDLVETDIQKRDGLQIKDAYARGCTHGEHESF